jgi:glucokinase
VDRIAFPTAAARGVEPVLQDIFAGIETLLAAHRLAARDIGRIGVSCGGPLDSRRGVILSPPNLPGWDEVPIVERLAARFGAAARLQNDANAGALAEWQHGAGRGCRNLVVLTFGTGLGAGLILDGRLYCGTNDLAGEVGHIRLAEHGPVGYGKEGSFEGFCSGGGLAQRARTRALERIQRGEPVSFCRGPQELERIDARLVAEAAAAGDPLAREIFTECGAWLGRGLAVLVDILNPQRIVLGGIFARAADLLGPPAADALAREALPRARGVCSVVPAALGEQIGDYGALAVAAMADGG